MHLISKIPRPLFVAALATLGFTLIYLFVIGSVRLGPSLTVSQALFIIFINFLPGIVSGIIIWLYIRRKQKNAWAIAIITSFAMLALFPLINILLGSIFKYLALLPVVWGLLVVNSRIFSGSKNTVLKFCMLFAFCAVLFVANRRFATWLFEMRPVY